MALHGSGKTAEARQTLAAAVVDPRWTANPARFPNDWSSHVLRREAETLILPNLPAFLDGKYQPQDNDERLALLGAGQFANRPLALARLYADVFAADAACAKIGDVIDLWASVNGMSLRQAALDLIRTFNLEPTPGTETRHG